MLHSNIEYQNLKVGKLYKVLKPIDIIPIEFFNIQNTHDCHDKVTTIYENSSPSIFLFIETILDKNNIKFSKILYKNKIFVTHNTYHLENKVKMF